MSQKLNRREFLKMAGMTGAGIALASCAPAQPTAAAPVATAGTVATAAPGVKKFKKTDLVVPSWWAPHEIAGAEKSFAGKFKTNTDLNLKYEFISGNFNEKVFTNLATDTPYDVISFNADSVPVYKARGLLTPLNDFIKRDNYDTSNIVPSALEQWNYDGQIYGLTADMGSFHCYFNYDLFAKAGITPPKPTELWTWDQLAEYAKKLTIKTGDTVTQWGLATGTDWCWEIWPNMNGAFAFSEGAKKCVIDDPAAIEAMTFYQKMVYTDGSCLKPGATKVSANDLFLGGQLGILIDGTWQVGYLRSKMADMKSKWDVGLLPHGPKVKQPTIPNFTAGWVLPKVAKDPEASWEAIKFYASDTFAEETMFTVLSGLPCTKSALAGEWYKHWPKEPPEHVDKEFYGKMLEYGAARRHLRYELGAEIIASMGKMATIYSNEQKPTDLLPKIAADVNGFLKDKPWNK